MVSILFRGLKRQPGNQAGSLQGAGPAAPQTAALGPGRAAAAAGLGAGPGLRARIRFRPGGKG